MAAMQTSTELPGSQRRFWREMMLVAWVLVAIFASVDQWLAASVEHRLLVDEIVDISNPAALYAKLDYLRRQTGQRVALLGDSVMLGRCLQQTGDAQWRQQGFAGNLQRHLESSPNSSRPCIMNLAFDGALPADLAEVARLLESARPDLVVADIGLRAFSEDFATPGHQYTRPWLAQMSINGGTLRVQPDRNDLAAVVASGLDDWLAVHWRLYRLRDLIRQTLLGGETRQMLNPLRERLIAWGDGRLAVPLGEEQKENAELDLLMKARSRYSTISLRADHAQRIGLESFLDRAKNCSWPTLLFFLCENPGVREAIIDSDAYDQLRQELDKIVQPRLGERLKFYRGLETIPAERYLDHIHVDAAGYTELFGALKIDINALVNAK